MGINRESYDVMIPDDQFIISSLKMQKKLSGMTMYVVLVLLLFCMVMEGFSMVKPITSPLPMLMKGKESSSSLQKLPTKERCLEYASKTLQQPRWGGILIGPLTRYINNNIVGTLFALIIRVGNKFTVHNKRILMDQVLNRPAGCGLLTVSNHQSVADDPGIWSAMLPMWALRPEQVRWALCTEDVFFYVRACVTYIYFSSSNSTSYKALLLLL